MKNSIYSFKDCTNCGACYNICPTQAIAVKNGMFFKPEVDKEKCVSCGKCLAVCPVINEKKVQNILQAYSAVHKDPIVVQGSSSGGAFRALADYILLQGGVVWGSCYDECFDNVIFKNTNEVDLELLQRSKYVESQIGDSFKKVREFLNNGRPVLFCAAPCQIAGLKAYIGCDEKNLYTCDFSCGGLASHVLYQQWLNDLRKKYRGQICQVNFRSKYFGWGTHAVCVQFDNGKQYLKPAANDPYFSAFVLKKASIRECCCDCKFSNNHYSDLILADFWLYKKFDGFEKNHTGISLVLINSEKGRAILQASSYALQLKELELDKATYNIHSTCMKESKRKFRSSFLSLAEKEGLKKASRKLCMSSKITQITYTCKLYIKNFLGDM